MNATKSKTATTATTKPTTATLEASQAEVAAADELFGDRVIQAAPRAYFTADCNGSIAGIAYAVTSRQVADPNRPGESKTLRSLVIRLTRAAEGKRSDEEVGEVPAGGELEVTVASALERLADTVLREPHGVVLTRGDKKKTPRGFQRTHWDIQALPMRQCRGVSKELAEELTESHARLCKSAPEPDYQVNDTEEAPF